MRLQSPREPNSLTRHHEFRGIVNGGESHMPQWAWFIIFIVAWVFLTQWLLPKLGVPT